MVKHVSILEFYRVAKLVETTAIPGNYNGLPHGIKYGLDDRNGELIACCFKSIPHFINCISWRVVKNASSLLRFRVCKGNYKSGPKVRVFGFPKNKQDSAKWLRAIRRDNFLVTPHSKVCELHFNGCDFEYNNSAFDQRTGCRITVPYKNPRLIKGRVPSKFPNLPGYLSSNSKTPREDPDVRRKRHEEDYLKLALQKSAAEQKNYDSKRMFSSLDDLHAKIEYIDTSVWTVFRKTDQINFCKNYNRYSSSDRMFTCNK
ncbi:uncharacterized protein LOC118202954 [Stegodyphus dumicola]|uniref:uncharacterized protein LOC118202954 n=1 Tax=Stegodyphus dumicola TaxID=202533 RepID=UPI0015A7D4B9|nr:uncharacterized protein LOC118202954 [Stegodyphus dumicola]